MRTRVILGLICALILASSVFAQTTTTLQGNVCSFAPASVHGCSAYGNDGMFYGFSSQAISFQLANGTGYTVCNVPKMSYVLCSLRSRIWVTGHVAEQSLRRVPLPTGFNARRRRK